MLPSGSLAGEAEHGRAALLATSSMSADGGGHQGMGRTINCSRKRGGRGLQSSDFVKRANRYLGRHARRRRDVDAQGVFDPEQAS